MPGNHLPGLMRPRSGIRSDSVSVKLEGSLDLRGFFAVKDGVRAGFNNVRGVVNLKSSAPASDLAKLKGSLSTRIVRCSTSARSRRPVELELHYRSSKATRRPKRKLARLDRRFLIA